MVGTAVQEPFFWTSVNDQLLLTTLDQNSALLIGLWQNTELGVCKKNLMYIMLLSFKKIHFHSVLEFYSIFNQHQMIKKLIQIP